MRLWQNGPMMRDMRRALPFAALALSAVPALSAAQVDTRNTYLGGSVGTYLFTDGDTRDEFGSAPISYGVALVQPYREARRGLRFDLASLALNANGNDFFMLGVTIGYEVQALRQGDKPTAFVRAGVGPAYYHVRVNRAGTANDIDTNEVSFIGSAEVGYTFADRFVLSAKYLATPTYGSLNFSGVQLQLTVAAFKL